jgi:hypothetical protein
MDPDLFYHWDDLRTPATNLKQGGADADTDGSLLFSSSVTENTYAILQMPHAWTEGGDITPHLHWSKTTDASGDVVWQIRYRLFNVNDVIPAWSDYLDISSRVGTLSDDQRMLIDLFSAIDMSDRTYSEMLSFHIRRKQDDTDDDYGADARLWEFDIHHQIDTPGSIEAFRKQ